MCIRDRSTTEKSPLTNGYQPVIWNFKPLANDMLGGFGGMGEGMSVQIAPDGRRIIWLAHESAPKNFTAVDVTDPRKPKVVCQTDLPHANMLSLIHISRPASTDCARRRSGRTGRPADGSA